MPKSAFDVGRLHARLLKIAKLRTARADEQLDQDGKPIVQSLAAANNDENTIIIEPSQDPAESLFNDA